MKKRYSVGELVETLLKFNQDWTVDIDVNDQYHEVIVEQAFRDEENSLVGASDGMVRARGWVTLGPGEGMTDCIEHSLEGPCRDCGTDRCQRWTPELEGDEPIESVH